MTAEEAKQEIYSIANNLMIDYSWKQIPKEMIIEDIQETIRLLNGILDRLNNEPIPG